MEEVATPLNRSQYQSLQLGEIVFLTTEVFENDIPLLLSNESMKKANTYVDFANHKIILKKMLVKFTNSGHYWILVEKILD